MKYNTPLRRVWLIVSPILLYYVVNIVISYIVSVVVTIRVMQTTSANDWNQLMQEVMMKALDFSVPVVCISGLVALPLLWRMMKKDSRLRQYKADKTSLEKWKLIYCVAAGILGCVAGSILVTISQMGLVFDGYEEVAENIFSQKLAIQLIAVGAVAPFVEEFIYRGLVYRRLKDYLPMNTAMIISAGIFGLTHGNLVQAVYGFAMGLLMAYVYEKYQTLAAPILCHGGANLVSVILQLMNVTVESVMVAGVIALVCLVMLYFVLRMIHSGVSVTMVLNEDYIDVSAGMASENHQTTGSWGGHMGNSGNDSNASGVDRSWRNRGESGFWKNKSAEENDSSSGGQRRYTVDDYYPKNNNDDDEDE